MTLNFNFLLPLTSAKTNGNKPLYFSNGVCCKKIFNARITSQCTKCKIELCKQCRKKGIKKFPKCFPCHQKIQQDGSSEKQMKMNQYCRENSMTSIKPIKLNFDKVTTKSSPSTKKEEVRAKSAISSSSKKFQNQFQFDVPTKIRIYPGDFVEFQNSMNRELVGSQGKGFVIRTKANPQKIELHNLNHVNMSWYELRVISRLVTNPDGERSSKKLKGGNRWYNCSDGLEMIDDELEKGLRDLLEKLDKRLKEKQMNEVEKKKMRMISDKIKKNGQYHNLGIYLNAMKEVEEVFQDDFKPKGDLSAEISSSEDEQEEKPELTKEEKLADEENKRIRKGIVEALSVSQKMEDSVRKNLIHRKVEYSDGIDSLLNYREKKNSSSNPTTTQKEGLGKNSSNDEEIIKSKETKCCFCQMNEEEEKYLAKQLDKALKDNKKAVNALERNIVAV